MIIYNVTVKVDTDIEADWLDWMKTIHIPDVMNTGLFTNYRICRILNMHDQEGTSYAIQYTAPDMAALHRYQTQHAPALQKDHIQRYGDRAVVFRTLMEIIED
ncbi:MAG: DUF4286 family protein [Phaeodactylibacter sp.]|nr:DUF4286 family protein [Phaeodactylibacter sp.]